MSSEPATPKNEVVKVPGTKLTMSLMPVALNCSRNSALMEDTERGVSSTVLPNPNTESTGSVCRMPNWSSTTSSATKVSKSTTSSPDWPSGLESVASAAAA